MATVTIRPNSDENYYTFACSSGSSRYVLLDETTLDTADYIYGTSGFAAFGFTDTGLSGATINSIKLYIETNTSSLVIRSVDNDDNLFTGHDSMGTVGTQYYDEFTTNPTTGLAWTISEVDTLVIGFRMAGSKSSVNLYQFYIVVDYTVSGTTHEGQSALSLSTYLRTKKS